MRDPTHTEMIAALSSFGEEPTELSNGAECFANCEVAIYWFANDWHGGQWSNLYSALSTSIALMPKITFSNSGLPLNGRSVFSPGPMGSLETEDETVREMYQHLESAFA